MTSSFWNPRALPIFLAGRFLFEKIQLDNRSRILIMMHNFLFGKLVFIIPCQDTITKTEPIIPSPFAIDTTRMRWVDRFITAQSVQQAGLIARSEIRQALRFSFPTVVRLVDEPIVEGSVRFTGENSETR